MTTNIATLPVAILNNLGAQNTAPLILSGDVENIEGLFAYAAGNGADVEAGISGLTISYSNDIQFIAGDGELIAHVQGDSSAFIADILGSRLRLDRLDTETIYYIKPWKARVEVVLNAYRGLSEQDRQTIRNLLDAIVEALTTLLPPANPWPFALSFVTSLGDANGAANLDYVQKMGAFTATVLGLNIHPPGDGGQAGAVTVQRFFQFSEDTRDSFRVAVHDFGSSWSAEFGGIQVDSRVLTVEDLDELSRNLFGHLSSVLSDPQQRGEAIMLLGAFILTAAQHLAAQAK